MLFRRAAVTISIGELERFFLTWQLIEVNVQFWEATKNSFAVWIRRLRFLNSGRSSICCLYKEKSEAFCQNQRNFVYNNWFKDSQHRKPKNTDNLITDAQNQKVGLLETSFHKAGFKQMRFQASLMKPHFTAHASFCLCHNLNISCADSSYRALLSCYEVCFYSIGSSPSWVTQDGSISKNISL